MRTGRKSSWKPYLTVPPTLKALEAQILNLNQFFYKSKTNDSERYKDRANQYLNDDYRYRKFPSSRGRNNRQKQNVENYDQWGQKTDPPGKSGNISRCPTFQSIYHWANDCPNKRKEE